MKKMWLIYKASYDTIESNPATRMYDEMIKNEIDCELVFLDYFKINNDNLYYKDKLITNYPYLVFMRGRDEILLSHFENHNVITINSSFCTKYCKDKWLNYQILNANNINQPYTEELKKLEYQEYQKKFNNEFIIKNKYGSQGTEVFLIKNKQEYDNIINNIETKDYIIQEYIKESYGKDVRAYVIGDEVIGSILRKNDNSFMSNIAQGGLSYNYTLTESEKNMVLKIAKILDGKIISVDFLITKEGLLFCEANSNAGFISFNFLGYPMRELMAKFIKKEFL